MYYIQFNALHFNYHSNKLPYSVDDLLHRIYNKTKKMEKGTRGANKNRQKGHNLSVALNIQPLKTFIPKIPSKLKIAQ